MTDTMQPTHKVQAIKISNTARSFLLCFYIYIYIAKYISVLSKTDFIVRMTLAECFLGGVDCLSRLCLECNNSAVMLNLFEKDVSHFCPE
jgi:hypothetical protein